ncbi:hypothetical protein JG687_00016824 [Phytophthora cactorum]|uniref:Uncharacterized protein n=1 Tax=Phytophthora cactorum TaxID=29920 RepID=A0A8T1TRB3_9STRA|nr:hypothetical protein JG687_00016824 [Phytophthora cactorum]
MKDANAITGIGTHARNFLPTAAATNSKGCCDYNPEQGEEAEESDVVDEHDGNIAAPSSKRKAKPTSKARRPKKPTQTKKTRKLSAAKVAKKRAKGKRRAAAELACGVSADAEERGAVALEDARKKREAIAATKARKWQKTTVTKATKVSPTRVRLDDHHSERTDVGGNTVLHVTNNYFYNNSDHNFDPIDEFYTVVKGADDNATLVNSNAELSQNEAAATTNEASAATTLLLEAAAESESLGSNAKALVLKREDCEVRLDSIS